MEEVLQVVQKAIDEKKGEDPILYEFSPLNPFLDYVVICSAPSVRQTHAISDNIKERLKEYGYPIRAVEGNKESRWVLVDVGTLVVHVFVDEERKHFKLEKLYADLVHQDFSL